MDVAIAKRELISLQLAPQSLITKSSRLSGMRTKSISERLRALEDEREILRTLRQYGHELDSGSEDGFLDCFTENCVWRSLSPDRIKEPSGELRRFEGREAMRKFYRSHTHAPEFMHRHLAAEPIVTLLGDDARVVSYLVRLDEHPEGPYLRAFGKYQDQFVRGSDGRWRILERIAQIDAFHARLSAHTPRPWQDLPLVVR